jgi:hypothetical protein
MRACNTCQDRASNPLKHATIWQARLHSIFCCCLRDALTPQQMPTFHAVVSQLLQPSVLHSELLDLDPDCPAPCPYRMLCGWQLGAPLWRRVLQPSQGI